MKTKLLAAATVLSLRAPALPMLVVARARRPTPSSPLPFDSWPNIDALPALEWGVIQRLSGGRRM